MSDCNCNCGCGCAPGTGCLLRIVLPDNPVEQYSAANINTLGIGFYDSQSGTEFDFRGAYSTNASLVIALDAANHAISFTLDTDVIIDDLPQATTTQRGVGETATDAEAIAKASITTFLTPSNLAALGASTTFSGFIEIATNAEALAGVSAVLAITPASLAAVVATIGDTKTWADAAARAALAPDFAGQLGVQLDTDIAWLATGTGANDFNRPLLGLQSANNVMSGNTTLDFQSNAIFLFDSSDFTGVVQFDLEVDFSSGGTLKFDGGVLNFDSPGAAFLQFGGAPATANSVMIIDGTAGNFTVTPQTNFLSSFNTSAGWTNFSNSAVRKTGDCNTITLPQLAQVVDTLIQALGTARQIPIP